MVFQLPSRHPLFPRQPRDTPSHAPPPRSALSQGYLCFSSGFCEVAQVTLPGYKVLHFMTLPDGRGVLAGPSWGSWPWEVEGWGVPQSHQHSNTHLPGARGGVPSLGQAPISATC